MMRRRQCFRHVEPNRPSVPVGPVFGTPAYRPRADQLGPCSSVLNRDGKMPDRGGVQRQWKKSPTRRHRAS